MKNYFFSTGILVISILFICSACGPVKEKLPEGGSVKLRSEYKALDFDAARAMLKKYGFHDRRWNKHEGFKNQFQLVEKVEKQPVVIDHSTGLTWHQSGSTETYTRDNGKVWIEELNRRGYGGYSDWRLPTLEEAASLVESKHEDFYYVNPLFSFEQVSMMTGDIYNEYRFWGISFNAGSIMKIGVMERDYVRPVRSGTTKTNKPR